MKTVAELEQQNMIWVRSGLGDTYELRAVDADNPDAPGETLATLTRHPFRLSATVEAPGNRWEFKQQGFWHWRVIIRSVGTGEEPAQLTIRGKSAVLVYPDGREYHWKSFALGDRHWLWSTGDDEPILGFHLRGLFQRRGEISIDPELAEQKAPTLLLFLGWYLILVYQSRSS